MNTYKGILIPEIKEIHIGNTSFDKWIIIGSILTYLEYLRVNKQIEDIVSISFNEIWRICFPFRKWGKELSREKRIEWLYYCKETVEQLQGNWINYDTLIKKGGLPYGISFRVSEMTIWHKVKDKYQWVLC